MSVVNLQHINDDHSLHLLCARALRSETMFSESSQHVRASLQLIWMSQLAVNLTTGTKTFGEIADPAITALVLGPTERRGVLPKSLLLFSSVCQGAD